MNNEPVAWMQVHHEDGKPTKFSKIQTWEDDVPLYTHPAKTLTDEEIKQIAVECGVYINEQGSIYPDDICIYSFARAILRKAQEKC